MPKEPGITLSKKHGVNPTMGACFWCGGDSGEIALLGRLKGDVQAPLKMVLSYTPCDKCKTNMELGITLIEVQEDPPKPGVPEIQKGLYPTGSWWVVKPDMITRIFSPESLVAEVLELKKGFIDRGAATRIGLHAQAGAEQS